MRITSKEQVTIPQDIRRRAGPRRAPLPELFPGARADRPRWRLIRKMRSSPVSLDLYSAHALVAHTCCAHTR